ncbi:hypothetical protein KAMFAM_244 [Bacillus phage Kamfam]|nr:hypothetical protein OTK52_242 [Bacillus phage OTooleKemple52]AXQ67082.1 hypothetical protein KAMFAM_244 [Bacillus phage Kamfam]
MGNKSYLVVGKRGSHANEYRETLYVGNDSAKAKSFTVDETLHVLEMEVWGDGIKLQKYVKKDIHTWELVLDRLGNLQRELTEKKEELSKLEEEVNKIKSIVEGE